MAEKSGKSVEHCDFVCIENLYTNTSTLRARAQLGKSVIPMPTHRVIGRLAIQDDGRWDVEVKFVKANEVQKLSEKPPSLQLWRKVNRKEFREKLEKDLDARYEKKGWRRPDTAGGAAASQRRSAPTSASRGAGYVKKAMEAALELGVERWRLS